MLEHLFTSLLAFISTNIDDLFILMLFFGGRRISHSHIIAGQYLGISVLIAVSFAGAFIGNFVDQRFVGLLGFFPIYLAVKQVILLLRNKENEEQSVPKSQGILAIAGVTIANGGDNIGVYIPLLTTMTIQEKILLVIVFMILTYTWCLAGKYLASRPLIARQLDRFGHILMPVVLILLGVFILTETGTLSWLIE